MKPRKPLKPDVLERNLRNVAAAGFDNTKPLRVISCTYHASTKPDIRRGEQMFVMSLRDTQVKVLYRRKRDRTWAQEWFGVWELASFRVRVLEPSTYEFRFMRLHKLYFGVEASALRENVNVMWATWQWHVDTRYRYLHEPGMVVEGVETFPGWIDAFSLPWAFNLVTQCERVACTCEGKPARKEPPR